MDDDTSIIKLINDNSWIGETIPNGSQVTPNGSTILDLLRDNKLDPNHKINQGNTIAHIAFNKGIKPIILYLTQTHPTSLQKLDSDGQTCLHILVKNANYDLLQDCISQNPELINSINSKSRTIIFDLIKYGENYDLINKLIHEYENINYDILDINHQNIIHALIYSYNKSKNQELLKLIKYIVTHHNINLNHPSKNLPLIYAIKKDNSKAVKLLLQLNADPNIEDTNYTSPLTYSIAQNSNIITKLLLDHKANPNNQGSYANQDPMFLAINNNNDQIINMLLNCKYDCRLYDKYLNTAAHHVLIKDPPLKYYTIFKVLCNKHSDMNKKNINSDSPLDILHKKYDVNIFKNLITYKLESENDMSRIHSDKNTLAHNNANNNNSTNIDFPIYKPVQSVTFVTTPLYNIMYTIIILLKYKSLCIPFQYDLPDKKRNDLLLLDFYYNRNNNVIYDIITNYSNVFYVFLPYLILWKSQDEYFIHPDLDFYITKCMNEGANTRFILLKISLIISDNGTHANVLIIDKKTGIVDRFDPYGNITLLNTKKLDDILEKKLMKILLPFVKITYLHNKVDYNLVSFQTISNDDNIKVKTAYDPFGYCLAWCIWYLELRIKNSEVQPHKLIKYSINKIISNYNTARTSYTSSEEVTETYIENTKKFNNYIRSYAAQLDNEKNDLLLTFGITKDHYYDIIFNTLQHNIIVNKLNEVFLNNVVARYTRG